jgi:hypothetical protein
MTAMLRRLEARVASSLVVKSPVLKPIKDSAVASGLVVVIIVPRACTVRTIGTWPAGARYDNKSVAIL